MNPRAHQHACSCARSQRPPSYVNPHCAGHANRRLHNQDEHAHAVNVPAGMPRHILPACSTHEHAGETGQPERVAPLVWSCGGGLHENASPARLRFDFGAARDGKTVRQTARTRVATRRRTVAATDATVARIEAMAPSAQHARAQLAGTQAETQAEAAEQVDAVPQALDAAPAHPVAAASLPCAPSED
eukprot:6202002-Pleurochrysis_carterae.AAC.5